MFTLKTRTPEGLCICIVKGNKCLCLQIPGDLSVISQKGGEVWSVEKIPAAMLPQASPKDTRVQIKNENKRLSNVFPTPQRCAGRNDSVNVFKSEPDAYLRPAAPNFSPLGNRGAEEKSLNKAPGNQCRHLPLRDRLIDARCSCCATTSHCHEGHCWSDSPAESLNRAFSEHLTFCLLVLGLNMYLLRSASLLHAGLGCMQLLEISHFYSK